MTGIYVHLKCGLGDSGRIVSTDQVQELIGEDHYKDWYISAYAYHEEMVEYFASNVKTNKKGQEYNSVAGYTGEAFTSMLHWDIDEDGDLPKAQKEAQILYSFLINELKISPDTVNIYFSGSKGFHITIQTSDKFNPRETSQICYNIAHTAGVNIDTVVYNPTRAFRVPNTSHQKSKLYKVQITDEQLWDWDTTQIKEYAAEPKPLFPADDQDTFVIRRDFYTEIEETKISNIEEHRATTVGLDMSKCPPNMRRCIFTLENGYFGPGERENALIRIAAFYRGQGKDIDLTRSIITTALNKREQIYPNTNSVNPEDTERVLGTVFADDWTGGTFSCKTDRFLQQHCDGAKGCKAHSLRDDTNKLVGSGFLSITELTEKYKKEAAEAPESFPETGITWIDDRVSIRPKCYSVVNGANGVGKTSFVTTVMDNFNDSQVHHAVFSMDMADNQLFLKLAAKHTAYSYRQIETAFANGEGKSESIQQEVTIALAKALPYTHFNFSSGMTVDGMGERILKLEQERDIKIQVVFVDYAGRLFNESDSMYVSATMNAISMNDVAKETNSHFMVLSQISREGGDHTDAIRTSRISKDSGAWEENATFMLNLWRPLGKAEFEHIAPDTYMTVFISKNRGEETYKECTLYWDGKRGHISEMNELEEQDFALDYFECFGKLPILNIIKPASPAYEALMQEMEREETQKKGNNKRTNNNAKKPKSDAYNERFGKNKNRRFG